MMRRLHSLRRLSRNALLLAVCAGVPAAYAAEQNGKGSNNGAKAASAQNGAKASSAQKSAAPAPQGEQFVDGIAAVVDKDVITLRELRDASLRIAGELKSRGIQVPDDQTLQHQVLQRLITERVQRHEADRMGIRVDDAQVDMAIQTIAGRNKITVPQLRQEIEKSGTSWDAYRKSLRDEIRMDRLRQRAVDSTIVISDAEVDAFLKDQRRNPAFAAAPEAQQQPQAQPQAQQQPAPEQAAAPAGPMLYALAQILVRVPEGSSPEQLAALRKKAEGLLAQAKRGDDFASLAAAASDGPEALQGGVMGVRPLDGWPDLFVKAISGLQKGQVSSLIQSGNGFHIIKVMDRGSAQPAPSRTARAPAPAPAPQPAAPRPQQAQQGPVEVVQTRARHILIKTSTVMSDELARQRLEQVRQRLVSGGAKFEDMARQYSQDATAPQGGELGWLNPGETVPPFEAAMNALQPGEISQPVQSPFGWHLIQVEERRQHDASDDMARMKARQLLFERRAQPAFEDWLEQLRAQAYVDNRLEKQQKIQQNNR
ncbi:Peptidyl-prolyl cis-trans isomerase surA [Achromobacter denitrificans]|uniref:Chaperone SurA n=1 Tax=Achromobacter denitrificans TaxID=32002 RepID=A0A6J5H625_ACHDE|nr:MULTISPECIES: peptidylprolyl isomerase [Achromobacter]ASC63883.1 molecular chaperone SurA [Achromobacter denitrificans]OLU07925.1 molecular chaperone SurA [Achromobacter denitrificans]QCS62272.1 molecular chaperone SurA [Achromobacter denitrificans]QKH45017.1 peptidylprolyl isomerase [Achromobacter denitrificans]QKH53641.1 peptidylprolyl isomerase [Achromobacter denitrificans]